MRERARVNSIEGSLVRVTVGLACDGSCSFCSKKGTSRSFEASNPKGFALSPGDEVEVFVSPQKAVLEGLLIFVMPLLLFAAGYLIATGAMRMSDTAGFVAGIIGVGIGILFNYVRGVISRNKSLPVITVKLS
jgi:positive regulator of sigma E activity